MGWTFSLIEEGESILKSLVRKLLGSIRFEDRKPLRWVFVKYVYEEWNRLQMESYTPVHFGTKLNLRSVTAEKLSVSVLTSIKWITGITSPCCRLVQTLVIERNVFYYGYGKETPWP
jgi:hypothetical protein